MFNNDTLETEEEKLYRQWLSFARIDQEFHDMNNCVTFFYVKSTFINPFKTKNLHQIDSLLNRRNTLEIESSQEECT